MAESEFTETPLRLIGYARVSTQEQNTDLQLAALRRAGAELVFEEKRSAVKQRPELDALLREVRRGDVVLVYKVDRLARSLWHLLFILRRLERTGAALRSLTEPFDTSTPMGRLFLQMLGSFAEFERSVIRERCAAGRAQARQRGVKFGRPRSFDYNEAWLLRGAGLTWPQVAARLGVPVESVRDAAKRARAKFGSLHAAVTSAAAGAAGAGARCAAARASTGGHRSGGTPRAEPAALSEVAL